MKWIYGSGVVAILLIIALFWQLGQTMDLNARLICEVKEMRIMLNTHDVRIKELAAENAWVREKVRITVGEK